MKLKVSQDSMLIWYPKIKDLRIPQPKTVMVPLTDDELEGMRKSMDGETIPDYLL